MFATNACSLAALLLLAACATTSPSAGPALPRFPETAPTVGALPAADAAAPAGSLVAQLAAEWDAQAEGAALPATDPADLPLTNEVFVAEASQSPSGRMPRWRDGAALLTGYFGASIYDVKRANSGVSVEADDVEVPAIGGGAQWKLAGDKIDLGLEGLIGFNWRASSTAVAVGGGGAAVAVDVDVFVLDLYGGPFASMFLGDAARIYAGVGPLMQWASYDESYDNGTDGDGFGLGYYARAGFDFHLGRGSLLGVGVRWSDVEIDLGGSIGDLQVDGMLFTVTYSYFY